MDKRRQHDDVAGMDDWEFAVVVRRRRTARKRRKGTRKGGGRTSVVVKEGETRDKCATMNKATEENEADPKGAVYCLALAAADDGFLWR